MKEINQLDLVAYIIVASKKITEFKNKDIYNYIDVLEDEFIINDSKKIYNYVDMRLFNDFHFRNDLNEIEQKNFAILILLRLLNYFHKEFDAKDIIKEADYIYNHFSVRTAKEEIGKLSIQV